MIDPENYVYMLLPVTVMYYLHSLVSQSAEVLVLCCNFPQKWVSVAPKLSIILVLIFIFASFGILYLLNIEYNKEKIDRKTLSLYFITSLIMFVAIYIVSFEAFAQMF